MADALESHASKIMAGMIETRALKSRDHEARPLSEHLGDFKASLRPKGSGGPHDEKTARRFVRVLELAGVTRISALSLSRVQGALMSLRSEGLGTESINHHVRAVKGFARWLWKDARSRDHNLVALSTTSPESDRRRLRRVLTTPEARALIVAAENGRTLQGLTGPDRAMLYRVALGTGFRAGELASLAPESFRLDREPPTIVCEGAYTKNGLEAEQPVPDALADALRPWLACKPPGLSVFGKLVRTADLIRADLAAAGVACQTASGTADFHSLRGCYISAVVSSGASVKTAQTLARHSTPTLIIGVYARASLHDIAGAVDALPDLGGTDDRQEANRSTGTGGRLLAHRRASEPIAGGAFESVEYGTYALPIKKVLAHPLPTGGDVSGRIGSDTDGTTGRYPLADDVPQTLYFSGDGAECRGESGTVAHISPGGGTADAGDSKSPAPPHLSPIPPTTYHPTEKPLAPPFPHDTRQTPPDLAEVVSAWGDLPEPIKAGILAMVRASKS